MRLDAGALELAAALRGGPALGRAVKSIKEQMRAVADRGVGYGLLRYLNGETALQLAGFPTPEVGFNYLGRFPAPGAADWAAAAETVELGGSDPSMALSHCIEVNALTLDGPGGPRLSAHWTFAPALLPEALVRELAEGWFGVLSALVRHAAQDGAGGLAALGDGPRLALRFARDDIAAGEAWRLVTGHLVHLDLEHAVLNVAGLLLVWALFSRVLSARQWALTVLAGVVAIDLGLWVVNVDLQWYVGASGVLHTAMAAGIVRQMLARDPVAWGLGVVGVGKLLYEHFSGAMPFTGNGALVVTDAHLYGAVAGMICGVLLRPGRVGSSQTTRARAG